MPYQSTFARHELKYLLTEKQKEEFLLQFPSFAPDRFCRTTIRNIYFDTPSYYLIRRSLEKPIYKEKLRLRCYQTLGAGGSAFLEIKKKFRSVVYKRRIIAKENDILTAIKENTPINDLSQIGKEIEFFRRRYAPLEPKVFLSYDREAYYWQEEDLRLTFDTNIKYRQDRLTLTSPPDGKSIIEDGYVLMEIKASSGIPLPVSKYLSEHKIFRTSFSKYGAAYKNIFHTEMRKKENEHF